MRHNPGAQWIQFDVALAGHEVRILLDQAGSETPLPLCTAAAVRPVDVLDVALAQRRHQLARAVRRST